MTNVNDLRIVKLYHVHSFDTNDYGFVIGINVLKDRSNFVLVKKCGDKYKIVPTDENQDEVLLLLKQLLFGQHLTRKDAV